MIQQRQFQKTHEDEHYSTAIFCHLQEFAIEHRDVTTMLCLDDKYCIKIGKPGFPVAAAGTLFEVGDHNFTKFSLVPIVTLVNTIPTIISESWYRGSVYFALKEGAVEPSSPARHATELAGCLLQLDCVKPVLLFKGGSRGERAGVAPLFYEERQRTTNEYCQDKTTRNILHTHKYVCSNFSVYNEGKWRKFRMRNFFYLRSPPFEQSWIRPWSCKQMVDLIIG